MYHVWNRVYECYINSPGLPLMRRHAPRVAELALRPLRFAVELVGPVATTVPLSCYIYLPLHVNGELKFVQT